MNDRRRKALSPMHQVADCVKLREQDSEMYVQIKNNEHTIKVESVPQEVCRFLNLIIAVEIFHCQETSQPNWLIV